MKPTMRDYLGAGLLAATLFTLVAVIFFSTVANA
jgi:hypothetical protein